jgi:hypothetical protein
MEDVLSAKRPFHKAGPQMLLAATQHPIRESVEHSLRPRSSGRGREFKNSATAKIAAPDAAIVRDSVQFS